ncbi:esterase/lipase family protein [Oceanobacillus kapialis]|uniref:Esterase/lipase family protein n=1 Tax=Oceanobacillus kapialis TaxID=481353 RepID=A0ABW5Q2J1_9BACI
MKTLGRISISLLLILLFGFLRDTILAQPLAPHPPTPVWQQDSPVYSPSGKGSNGNDETPGEWYAGDTPANLQEDAPVLLFVPGLNNVAQIFWEDNDMYQTALDAGYQTAFVQLHDAGGASADMWENGQLLAEKIEEISAHFSNKPITVIAYSKGGVDTHAAITYYGAGEFVENVITLSSPHHGSQLADLANSSWAGWLADLIGAQGEGTTAVETGYMEYFRSITDVEPAASAHDYYTIGGTDWGSMFSSTWFGGMYLNSYGDNDGVVTASSSHLPVGELLEIGNWNHTTVRSGDTFPIFENVISDNSLARLTQHTPIHEEAIQQKAPLNQWITGGELIEAKEKALPITIDESIKKANLQLFSAAPLLSLELLDPTGKSTPITPKVTENEEGYFINSISHHIALENLQTGTWQLRLKSSKENAYLLVADYTGENLVSVEADAFTNKSNLTQTVTVDKSQVKPETVKATYYVKESGATPEQVRTYENDANLSQTVPLQNENQSYVVTIEVEGLTKEGNAFKRTFINSVYRAD